MLNSQQRLQQSSQHQLQHLTVTKPSTGSSGSINAIQTSTTTSNGNSAPEYFIFDDLTTALQERSNIDQTTSSSPTMATATSSVLHHTHQQQQQQHHQQQVSHHHSQQQHQSKCCFGELSLINEKTKQNACSPSIIISNITAPDHLYLIAGSINQLINQSINRLNLFISYINKYHSK